MGDTEYSQRSFLEEQSKHKNLVVIARVRSNRIFYQSPIVDELKKKRGCPKKYGDRFDLADAETWHEADEKTEILQTTPKGRPLNVTIQAWHQQFAQAIQFGRTAKSEWDWRSRSVFVVGDADQSIYSFRMADFTLPILEDGNGSRVMIE